MFKKVIASGIDLNKPGLLVHFTNINYLPSILRQGLLSGKAQELYYGAAFCLFQSKVSFCMTGKGLGYASTSCYAQGNVGIIVKPSYVYRNKDKFKPMGHYFSPDSGVRKLFSNISGELYNGLRYWDMVDTDLYKEAINNPYIKENPASFEKISKNTIAPDEIVSDHLPPEAIGAIVINRANDAWNRNYDIDKTTGKLYKNVPSLKKHTNIPIIQE